MRPDPASEAKRWLRQADHDLETAKFLADGARHSDVCFHAQQAAEKAIKAVRYLNEGGRLQGHDLSSTSGQLQAVVAYDPSFQRLMMDAAVLDQYYIPPRYPDAFPSGSVAPFEAFSEVQATDAITRAERILDAARDRIRA